MTATHPPVVPLPRLPRALREFVQTETASGALLLVAAAVALVWATLAVGLRSRARHPNGAPRPR